MTVHVQEQRDALLDDLPILSWNLNHVSTAEATRQAARERLDAIIAAAKAEARAAERLVWMALAVSWVAFLHGEAGHAARDLSSCDRHPCRHVSQMVEAVPDRALAPEEGR